MIETIVIGLICVFLAYLGRYRRLSWGFGAAMTILFVFLAIRYEWGNDYRQYIDKFTVYNSIDEFNYSDPNERWEVGWIFLYRIFKPFGFFSLVIVLTAFENICLLLVYQEIYTERMVLVRCIYLCI